jgi:hypothetical protein
MRTVRIEHVVAPVGIEDGAVGFAILSISGPTVRCVEDREKIREQIDQHGGTIWCGVGRRKTERERGEKSVSGEETA